MKRISRIFCSVVTALGLWSGTAIAQSAIGPEELAGFRSLDENFAQVARVAPLFAGLYVDGDTLVYRLATRGSPPSEAQQSDVVDAVNEVFGESLARFARAPRRFETAAFAMADLTRWHIGLTQLQALKGFVYSDLDERRSLLVVATVEGTDLTEFRNRVEDLEIPLEAVEFRTQSPIGQRADLNDRHRPLLGGIQIGTGGGGRCTASLFIHFAGHPNFVQGMITNSHCGGDAADQGVVTAHRFTQPSGGFFGSNAVGPEVFDPPFDLSHAQCGTGQRCRMSDTLVAHVEPPTDMSRGLIARIGNWGGFTLSSRDPDYQVSWIAWYPLMGERVTKVGRTTGKTRGEVTGTCSPVTVSDDNGDPTDITLVCQYLVEARSNLGGGVTPIVGPGDSGSPVFALPSNPLTPNDIHAVYLHGILWGGSTDGELFSFSSALNTLLELTPETGPIVVVH